MNNIVHATINLAALLVWITSHSFWKKEVGGPSGMDPPEEGRVVGITQSLLCPVRVFKICTG